MICKQTNDKQANNQAYTSKLMGDLIAHWCGVMATQQWRLVGKHSAPPRLFPCLLLTSSLHLCFLHFQDTSDWNTSLHSKTNYVCKHSPTPYIRSLLSFLHLCFFACLRYTYLIILFQTYVCNNLAPPLAFPVSSLIHLFCKMYIHFKKYLKH